MHCEMCAVAIFCKLSLGRQLARKMKSGSFEISYELFVPTVINSFDPFWHAFLTVAHLHQMHGDGGFAHLS